MTSKADADDIKIDESKSVENSNILTTNKSKLKTDFDTPEDIRRIMKGDLKNDIKSTASEIRKTWKFRQNNVPCYDENVSSTDNTPLITDISRCEDSSIWEPKLDDESSSDDSNGSPKTSKQHLLCFKKKSKKKKNKASNSNSIEPSGATPSPLKGFKKLVLRD